MSEPEKRVWDTDRERERKAEYRRRRKEFDRQAESETLAQAAFEAAESEQALRDRLGYAASESRSRAERQATADRILGKAAVPLDEESYVQREVELTREAMASGHLKEAVDAAGRGRLERAEAYARWRWREYHSGAVASL